MITRHSRTHGIGLVAGLSLVSSSVLGMFLASGPGSVPATKSCAAAATATRAVERPATRVNGSHIRLTALAVQASTPKPSASSTPSPAATSQQPTPSVAPGSPNATASSSPKSTASPGPSGSPQPSPNKTATPSPSPTPSTSPSPSPTPTKTPPPPRAHLCLSVQSLKGSSVIPGTHARYAIWVWLTAGTNGSAKISLSAKPNSMSPVFTVCQPAGNSSCTVAGLAAGQRVELQAKIAVPKHTPSTRIILTATGTSPQATSSASSSVTVAVQDPPTHSPKPTPPSGGNPGNGDPLPPGISPGGGLPPGSLPGVSIPGLPTPTGNAGAAFPQVGPSQQPSPNVLPQARAIRATDVSAGLPLNVRVIGGQLVGLAILAAAVTIAVARLSVRRRPRKPEDTS